MEPAVERRIVEFSAQLYLILEIIKKRDYYPQIEIIEEIAGCGETVIIKGVPYDNFASNSYLGLSRHSKVIESAKRALDRFGIGSGGSRLTSGTTAVHRQLEERIARFKGTEDAVVFSSGFLANLGILLAIINSPVAHIAAELDPEAVGLHPATDVFFDELVHASVIDGTQLSQSRLWGGRVRAHRYLHRDVEDLEQKLSSTNPERALIVTDGVFSLHGRVAPLDKIVEIAQKYGASVYVDDAHGTGVLGPNGRGTADLFGLGEVEYAIGTLSKAFGGEGGFFVGDARMCEYLRVACRTQVFQTSMSSAIAAGLITAIDVAEEEPERRERLVDNAIRINSELVRLGFDTFGSRTQIIPVCFETEERAKRACKILASHRIFAPPYYYPAVRRREAMIRVNLMATHSGDQLERLVTALKHAGEETGVL